MYRIEKDNGTVTVYAEGRIDTNGAQAFGAAMEEVLKDATELIIDCSALEYISSSGLPIPCPVSRRETWTKWWM